ncbi:MAG: group 2 family glycosyl transferase [Bacteroidota bacterium]|nr:group 2 family glycosyl transferase [Bacteroidota bacterium]
MILFFILLLLLLMYGYIFYPMLLSQKAKGKIFSFLFFTNDEELPMVSIVMPLQNEEKVIEEKLNSILASDYPKDKLSVYIGLDCCSDATKQIIETKFNSSLIHVIEFNERQGKPNVLNKIIGTNIVEEDSILILTDANIIFTPTTVFELVKYFKDPQIGLVDSNIQHKKITNDNEKDYWNYETAIKHNESLAYGIIPGPSGGCYAIRKNLYTSVPDNFLVDDFFIGFTIITKLYKAILNRDAICYEDVVTNWSQEFSRKIRIATGNFQNFWYFKRYAFQFLSPVGRVFISHKILRWKSPFILLIMYYILLLKFTLFILIVTLFLPIIDLLFFTFDMEFKPLRRFNYFIVMNIAVFLGFLRFCKGVKSNVWQPTTR